MVVKYGSKLFYMHDGVRMSEQRDRVKARMQFLYACDGIELSAERLERFADLAEQSPAGEEDPAWRRAQERAKTEGRSAAALFLEESQRTAALKTPCP